MPGIEDDLRVTVAALMANRGERQTDLAVGLGQAQAQISRKLTGRAHWSLEDVDLLAAHYRLHTLDLLAGPTHALGVARGDLPALKPVSPWTTIPAAPAPEPTPPVTTPPTPAPTPPAPVEPCVLCGQPAPDEVDGFPQHLTAEDCAAAIAATRRPTVHTPRAPALDRPSTPTAQEQPTPTAPPTPAPAPADTTLADQPTDTDQQQPAPAPAPTEPAPAPASPPPSPSHRSTPHYASGTLIEQITDRVRDVLAEHGGDLETAQAALLKTAIPDVMALLKASRVGGRYEHSEFPPTAEILRKKSQKGADEIWEGRPKWRNTPLLKAAKQGERFEVTALDMNAAYLSALKCHLPIGQLREDTTGVHDPKKAGVHLITPPAWDHPDLPNPLGNRMEPGELWVTESTLRLLLDCARKDLADAPVIHRSLVSGASEALLEKLRRALTETRRTALAEGDELTVAYVKAMYSKFVSTIGESSANREIRRPDWMHLIRAKAFANLWMKAHKAHTAGLKVVEISGTDELHVIGDWRTAFTEGRDLNQVKQKDVYTLGGER
ncbi:acyltransferase [Streptomyces termitum]|uniref:acyltransferase n=1 Tax=Streptomyces termitum TaxID=67368 RepID=UPI0033A89ECB